MSYITVLSAIYASLAQLVERTPFKRLESVFDGVSLNARGRTRDAQRHDEGARAPESCSRTACGHGFEPRTRYLFHSFVSFVLFVFFLLRLQPEAQREEAREPMTPWEHERGEREA